MNAPLFCPCPSCRALRAITGSIIAVLSVLLLAIIVAAFFCGCVQRYNVVEVYGNAPLTISVNADVDHANQLTPKVSLK